MSIAKSLVSVLPSFSKATNITEAHSVKCNTPEIRTLMFDDLSLLKINENEQKGYVAEPRNIEKVEFGNIKKQKKLFGEKKQMYSDIVKNKKSNETDLSFVKIKISQNNRIEMGIDSIFLTSDKDCFSLSLSENTVKGLKIKEASEIFSSLNIDADHLTSFLKEKNDLNKMKNDYKHDDQDVLNLLKNKSSPKQENAIQENPRQSGRNKKKLR